MVRNADQLRKLGIRVVAALPGVGENLQDHPLLFAFSAETELYTTRGSRSECHLFLRSHSALPAPDIQILLTPVASGLPGIPLTKGFSLSPALIRPHSRGRLTMTSANPGSPLHIDPNFLAEESDVNALSAGVEACTRLGLSQALGRWRAPAVRVAPSGKSEVREVIKSNLVTFNHAVGTCAMGVGDAPSLTRLYAFTAFRTCEWPTDQSCRTLLPAILSRRRS
jgi:choline dehydrogenase